MPAVGPGQLRRRGVLGLPLAHALSFAPPFLLDTEGVARAEAFDLSVASCWEEEKFIDLSLEASRRQFGDERAAHELALPAGLPWKVWDGGTACGATRSLWWDISR